MLNLEKSEDLDAEIEEGESKLEEMYRALAE